MTLGGAGSSGLSPNLPLAFPTTDDGSIPGQLGLVQDAVEDLLRGRMQASPGWQSATEIGFAGLPANLPLVVGIIAKMAEQITGLPIGNFVEMWTNNPVVANLSTVAQGAMAAIYSVQANLQSMFGGLNFLDPDFDFGAAVVTWIQNTLLPTGLFAGIENFITVIRGWIEGTDSGFPYSLPMDFSGAQSGPALWFRNITQFLGIDFMSASFNPLEAAQSFVVAVIKPLGAFAELIGGKLSDLQAPPILGRLIAAIGNGIEQVELFFARLRSFLSFDFLSPNFDLVTAGSDFITNIIKPLGLLAPLVGGKLPDINAPQVVADLVQNMVNALNSVNPVNSAIGFLGQAWSVINNLMNGITGNASQIAQVAAQVNASGGASYSTTFDGAANLAPFATMSYSGGGAGSWILDGGGRTAWVNLGGTPRQALGHSPVAATKKNHYAGVVLAGSIEGVTASAYQLLYVRSTLDFSQLILARISFEGGGSKCEIGTYIGGVFTPLLNGGSSSEPGPMTYGGQQWALIAGTSLDPDWSYELKFNNQTVMVRTDSGNQVSTANRIFGGGQRSGISFFGGASIPPNLDSFSGGDITL